MAIARATGGFLALLRELLKQVSRIANDDLRDVYLGDLRKVTDILEAHAVQENAISVDTNLSDAGQQAKIVELAKETLKKLRFLLSKADDTAGAYNRLEALLLAVPDAPKNQNELITYLREQEIRTWLRSLSAPDRMQKYQLAVQQENAETIRALRLAPGEPLIAKDIQDRFDREHLERTKPQEMLRLHSLGVIRDELHALAVQLFRWLQGYGAKFDFDGATPPLKSAQHLLGYGDTVTFPVPIIKPANFTNFK